MERRYSHHASSREDEKRRHSDEVCQACELFSLVRIETKEAAFDSANLLFNCVKGDFPQFKQLRVESDCDKFVDGVREQKFTAVQVWNWKMMFKHSTVFICFSCQTQRFCSSQIYICSPTPRAVWFYHYHEYNEGGLKARTNAFKEVEQEKLASITILFLPGMPQRDEGWINRLTDRIKM